MGGAQPREVVNIEAAVAIVGGDDVGRAGRVLVTEVQRRAKAGGVVEEVGDDPQSEGKSKEEDRAQTTAVVALQPDVQDEEGGAEEQGRPGQPCQGQRQAGEEPVIVFPTGKERKQSEEDGDEVGHQPDGAEGAHVEVGRAQSEEEGEPRLAKEMVDEANVEGGDDNAEENVAEIVAEEGNGGHEEDGGERRAGDVGAAVDDEQVVKVVGVHEVEAAV